MKFAVYIHSSSPLFSNAGYFDHWFHIETLKALLGEGNVGVVYPNQDRGQFRAFLADFSPDAILTWQDWVVPKHPHYEMLMEHKQRKDKFVICSIVDMLGPAGDIVAADVNVDLLVSQWYGPAWESLQRKWGREVLYFPHGYGRVHQYLRKKRTRPITFVGNRNVKHREKYLRLLDPRVFVYGLLPGPLVELYNGTRVCPNAHHDWQKDEFYMLNSRFWQVLACGTLQVCDYVPGIEDFQCPGLIIEREPAAWISRIRELSGRDYDRVGEVPVALAEFSHERILSRLVEAVNGV